MEKRKPAHDLAEVKTAFCTVKSLRATTRALDGARQLGFAPQDMVDTIQSIARHHFYKSMTSYADHKVWQDVYHVPYRDLEIYVKITKGVITGFSLLSFKEK